MDSVQGQFDFFLLLYHFTIWILSQIQLTKYKTSFIVYILIDNV